VAAVRALLATALLSAGLWPAGGGAAFAREPAAPASREAIVAYRVSGEWDRDLTRVVDGARAQLERSRAERPALVLDVDDTSLSSYDCLARRGFRRSPDSPCARSGRLPAIPQTLGLYRTARDRGIAVVFITGRREALRRVTLANLRAAGFDGRLQLVMRPDRERPGTHDGFKARRRRSLERRGLTVVANVGDQRSDLSGGAAQRTFKLPNPMYLIPSA
jgi:HAD superfamily, subfamily IIIB (Acid phosphatase)